MNTKTISIVAIIIVVAIIALSRFQKEVKPTISGETITIGDKVIIQASLARSGEKKAWGEAALNGAQQAVKEINELGGISGRQIELVIQDNGSKAPNAFSTNKLVISPDTDIQIFNPSNAPNLFSTWYGTPPQRNLVPRPPEKTFIDSYEKSYGTKPAYGASTAYDAIYIIARTVYDNPNDIAHYMRAINFRTVSYGNITFDERGRVNTPGDYFVEE